MWYDTTPDNKRCPICKKKLPRNRGGYSHGGRDYCSWTCVQEADRQYKASKEYQTIQTELEGNGRQENADPKKVTDEELDSWIRMLLDGYTVTEISKAYERDYGHVHHRLSRLGLLPPGRSKLTFKQADEICRRIKAGEKIQTLADEMGVSVATVHRIAHCGWQNGRK